MSCSIDCELIITVIKSQPFISGFVNVDGIVKSSVGVAVGIVTQYTSIDSDIDPDTGPDEFLAFYEIINVKEGEKTKSDIDHET